MDAFTSATVVTGAASGIGRAIVQRFEQSGRTVIAIDLDQNGLEALDTSNRVVTRFADVRDSTRLNEIATELHSDGVVVDGIVCAAGVLRFGRFDELSDTDWNDLFGINAFGTFASCRAFVPGMIERKRGSVVAIASNAARIPRIGMSAYGASKAAIVSLVQTIGLEAAHAGVRCNIVCPGSTMTPMQTQFWESLSPDAAEDAHERGHGDVLNGSREGFRVGIPLGRIAEPNDVADLVEFLISDQARHITLQKIDIDGGAGLGV